MDLTFSELDEYNFQDSDFDYNNFNQNNNSKNESWENICDLLFPNEKNKKINKKIDAAAEKEDKFLDNN